MILSTSCQAGSAETVPKQGGGPLWLPFVLFELKTRWEREVNVAIELVSSEIVAVNVLEHKTTGIVIITHHSTHNEKQQTTGNAS